MVLHFEFIFSQIEDEYKKYRLEDISNDCVILTSFTPYTIKTLPNTVFCQVLRYSEAMDYQIRLTGHMLVLQFLAVNFLYEFK